MTFLTKLTRVAVVAATEAEITRRAVANMPRQRNPDGEVRCPSCDAVVVECRDLDVPGLGLTALRAIRQHAETCMDLRRDCD